MNESNGNNGKVIPLEIKPKYKELAVSKIAKELEEFTGGMKEKTVSKFVASTLTHFCEENERFAEVVYKTQRTLSDCCAEVMKGTGNQISDIDVYRGAVRHYFKNADISFKMEICITGEAPTEEEIMKKLEKKPAKKSKHSKKITEKDVEFEEELSEDSDEIENNTKKVKIEKIKKNNSKAETNKPKKEVFQLSLFD